MRTSISHQIDATKSQHMKLEKRLHLKDKSLMNDNYLYQETQTIESNTQKNEPRVIR